MFEFWSYVMDGLCCTLLQKKKTRIKNTVRRPRQNSTLDKRIKKLLYAPKWSDFANQDGDQNGGIGKLKHFIK